MIVKAFITLEVDKEEYPIPADEDVTAEISEAIEEFIYDIDGLKIKHCKVIMGEN